MTSELKKINNFYAGGGFLLKPLYRQFEDNSGQYLAGYTLYYEGVEADFYPIPDDMKWKPEEFLKQIAESINNEFND